MGQCLMPKLGSAAELQQSYMLSEGYPCWTLRCSISYHSEAGSESSQCLPKKACSCCTAQGLLPHAVDQAGTRWAVLLALPITVLLHIAGASGLPCRTRSDGLSCGAGHTSSSGSLSGPSRIAAPPGSTAASADSLRCWRYLKLVHLARLIICPGPGAFKGD